MIVRLPEVVAKRESRGQAANLGFWGYHGFCCYLDSDLQLVICERLAWAGEQRESLAGSRTAVGRLPCCAGVSWLSRMLRAGNTVILSVPSVLADNQAISGWVIRCGTLNLHKCSQIGSRTRFKMISLEYVPKCKIDLKQCTFQQDHQ